MADRTDDMIPYQPINETVLFEQGYHSDFDKMHFRLSGLSNGDYVNLGAWMQYVWEVHAYRNNDCGGGNETMSVQISGTYPNNYWPVITLHDPDGDVVYSFLVVGKKDENATAFAGSV